MIILELTRKTAKINRQKQTDHEIWWLRLMVDFEILWPQEAAKVCSSLIAVKELPRCAWGQHALVSSSLQVCDCSRFLKLFDYCPNSG